MNEDYLLKELTKIAASNNFNGKSDISHKSFGSEAENVNCNFLEVKHPKNLFEIREALEQLRLLRINNKDKKDYIIQDKVTELTSFLLAGIVLDEIPRHREIIDKISSFLVENGFSEDFVIDNLRNMEGRVLPVEVLNGGKAQALRTHIDLEIDFFDYDSEGRVIGVNPEKEELYYHVVTHEFFHKLSSYKNGFNDALVAGDAFLEGYTDYFTKLALGGSKIESDLYGFPVKVCEMFTEIMGLDKSLDDYINHTGDFPNLKNLFSECGLDKESFLEFNSNLNSIIVGVRRDKLAGLSKEEWAKDEKMCTLEFLRNNIIIPYCRNNPTDADRILDKFNNLFSSSGYSCSIEDVNCEKKV